MNVTVKLYAGFRQLLPPDARIQGLLIEVHEHATPGEVLENLNVPKDEVHLVLLNGVFVESSKRNQPILKNNDILAVWPAVAGG